MGVARLVMSATNIPLSHHHAIGGDRLLHLLEEM